MILLLLSENLFQLLKKLKHLRLNFQISKKSFRILGYHA
nr:MAG TPA: hypothetical protein [Caudoviricetes sp.]